MILAIVEDFSMIGKVLLFPQGAHSYFNKPATEATSQMFPKYHFPLEAYTVTDGDTIAVTLDLGWDTFVHQSCRLLGVDAPEKNTAAGKAAKRVVESKLAEHTNITVESVSRDKYAGRFVGRVWLGEQSLNQYLIDNQLAKFYDGGKKQPWTPEELEAVLARCEVLLS
jgi:micrococcal nuclease